jgi:hypothetical protein
LDTRILERSRAGHKLRPRHSKTASQPAQILTARLPSPPARSGVADGARHTVFEGASLPGLAFIATATGGSNAVNPVTGAGISTNWEYDLELAVRGDAMDNAPDWSKPVNPRNRVAFVDRYQGRTVNSYTEYRVQLNYKLTWKGLRLR